MSKAPVIGNPGSSGKSESKRSLAAAVVHSEEEIYPEKQLEEITPETKSQFGKNSSVIAASHFFKALFGPTILVMPAAFKNGGLIFATFGHVLMVTLISYNIGRLVNCADYLSKRENLMIKTYDQVAFVSFNTCCARTKTFAKPFRLLVNIMVIITTFDALTIFVIFISRNVTVIVEYYFPYTNLNVRHFIFFLMIPIMVPNTIRTLKYLTPFSVIACLILYSACICCFEFYLLQGNTSVWERTVIGDYTIIRFIAMILFSQSGISIALTIKSSMRNPQHFNIIFSLAIFASTVVYVPFGFFGYLKYGEGTKPSIMLNLPNDEKEAIIVKLLTILSVFMTIPIGFYIIFNVTWNNFFKSMVSQTNQLAVEYFLRAALYVLIYIVATVLPTLGPMIVLKGSLFHSHLEVIYPPIVEFATYYPEKGTGKGHCRLIRLIFIASLGVFFCLGGTCFGIWDLIEHSDELIV